MKKSRTSPDPATIRKEIGPREENTEYIERSSGRAYRVLSITIDPATPRGWSMRVLDLATNRETHGYPWSEGDEVLPSSVTTDPAPDTKRPNRFRMPKLQVPPMSATTKRRLLRLRLLALVALVGAVTFPLTDDILRDVITGMSGRCEPWQVVALHALLVLSPWIVTKR